MNALNTTNTNAPSIELIGIAMPDSLESHDVSVSTIDGATAKQAHDFDRTSHPTMGYQPGRGVYLAKALDSWTSGEDYHLEMQFDTVMGSRKGWFYLPAGSEAQRTYDAVLGVLMAAGLNRDIKMKIFIEGQNESEGFPKSIVTALIPYLELTWEEICGE